jgi:hypothetical protein
MAYDRSGNNPYDIGNIPSKSVTRYEGTQNVTQSSAAPTTGTWTRGDRCWNNAPSASGPPGWVCIESGTPGTWKAMGNLAA